MTALLATCGLFASAWVVHFVWWRVRAPSRHLAALMGLFGAVPIAAGILAALSGRLPIEPADLPAVLVLYAGAAASYLIVYTGVEQTSPTLVIVRALDAAGPRGCSEAELGGLITEDAFVAPRLRALMLDGLIVDAGTGWGLTARGRRAATISSRLATFLGIRENA
jgi:hypothetical protein